MDLDPRWNWAEVTAIGDRERVYIKTTCNHLELEPVHQPITGRLVATLCLTCNTQFYAPWVTELANLRG